MKLLPIVESKGMTTDAFVVDDGTADEPVDALGMVAAELWLIERLCDDFLTVVEFCCAIACPKRTQIVAKSTRRRFRAP